MGNRTKVTEANGDYTDYGYDDSYTLRTEERKNVSASRIYKYEYEYDTAGNRTKKILSNSAQGSPHTYTYSYIDNNLLQSISGAASGWFTYDYSGNQSSRDVGGPDWTYVYDGANRLTRIYESGGDIATFKYDVLGRRIERWDGSSGTRRFIYNGSSLVAEMNDLGSIIAWYTPGICESRYDGVLWHTYYYCTDHLGSTRELVDSMQRVTDAYAYNAWGENLGQLRPPSDPDKPSNPLRFVGKAGYQTDDATGLMLLGARYYDPLIGRFITQDPIRSGLNWYAYADGNPVAGIDPSGLHTLVFGGEKLKLFEDGGKMIDWVPAYSGRAGLSAADVNTKGGDGPIPPGTYSLDMTSAESNVDKEWKHWLYAATYMANVDDWGNMRVHIDTPDLQAFKRQYPNRKGTGFFLHGGKTIGSAGCIDIGWEETRFIQLLQSIGDDSMKLVTDYSGWTGVVPGIPAERGAWDKLNWPTAYYSSRP